MSPVSSNVLNIVWKPPVSRARPALQSLSFLFGERLWGAEHSTWQTAAVPCAHSLYSLAMGPSLRPDQLVWTLGTWARRGAAGEHLVLGIPDLQSGCDK